MSLIPEKRDAIVRALELGMPLKNVAHFVEIPLSAIEQEMLDDLEFAATVNRAVAHCMHDRLRKLEKLQNWQALAFILQSLWPERFGRKTRRGPRMPRSGRKLPPSPDQPDFDRLSDAENDALDHLLAKLHGRTEPNRSGAGVQV